MKKIISFLTITFTLSSLWAFDLPNKTFPEFNGYLEDITDELETFLPENTTMLSIQPDAFIGKFFPSIPPRFAAGLSFAGTLIDTETFSDNLESMSKSIVDALPEDFKTVINFSIPQKIFLPTAAASFRIGGILLPFDAGIYAITTTDKLINDVSFDDYKFNANYTCIGADIRYALLEGGILLPKVSVGAGYIWSQFNAGLEMEKTLFNTEYGIGKLNGEMNVNLTGHTVYAQAQVSKRILLFTPFAGLKAFATVYNSDVDWKITTSGLFVNLNEKDSYSTSNDFDKIYYQFYTDCGIQLAILQVSLNGAYNFSNKKLSAGLAVNVKI